MRAMKRIARCSKSSRMLFFLLLMMATAMADVSEAFGKKEEHPHASRELRKSFIGWRGESHVVPGRSQAAVCRALTRSRSGHIASSIQARNLSIAVGVHRAGTKLASDAYGPSTEALTDGRVAVAWIEKQYGGIPKIHLKASADKFARVWDEETHTVHMADKLGWNPVLLSHERDLHVFFVQTEQECQGQPVQGGIIREVLVNEISMTASVPRTIATVGQDRRSLATTSHPIKLREGHWILPFRYLPACDLPEQAQGASVLITGDKGQTWVQGGEVRIAGKQIVHNAVVELTGGSLFMVLGTNNAELYSASSLDQGKTWSTPKTIQIKAGSPKVDIAALAPGEFLAIAYVGHEEPKHPEDAQDGCPGCSWKVFVDLSVDSGSTWTKFASVDVKKSYFAEEPSFMQVGCSLSVFYSAQKEATSGKPKSSALTHSRVPIRVASTFVHGHREKL